MIRASLLHFQLGYDHPFVDGNGRTARALFYWYMLRKGYPLFRYLTISRLFLESRPAYGRAYLHTEQTNDLTYFLLYHTRMVRRSIDEFWAFVTKKRKERESAERTLREWGKLNLRQRLLIQNALKDPAQRYTADGHMRWHGITRLTALKDLHGLVDLRLFEREKQGKTFVFRPSDGLQSHLARGPSKPD